MSIGGIGGAREALSSGVDSIFAGISRAAESGGLSTIQDTIQAFGKEGFNSFDPTALKGFSEIAGPGFLTPPAAYFSKLSSMPSPVGAQFQPAEIAGKLQDSSLNLQSQLENLTAAFEEKINTAGDDAQLANVDLQNVLQKAQQALQMLSNISKMFHDTAISIVRKIGG